MTTETRQYTVASFDDLTEEQQEKVLENYRHFNVEYDWSEYVIDDHKEKLEALGFSDVKIAFSGFWSQGDGASFTASSLDVLEYLKARGIQGQFNLIDKALKSEDLDISINVSRHNSHYYHERSTSVNMDWNLFSDDEDEAEESKELEQQLKDLEEYIAEDILELNRSIYKELEKDYEHRTSDEAIKESLIANDYIFDTRTLKID